MKLIYVYLLMVLLVMIYRAFFLPPGEAKQTLLRKAQYLVMEETGEIIPEDEPIHPRFVFDGEITFEKKNPEVKYEMKEVDNNLNDLIYEMSEVQMIMESR